MSWRRGWISLFLFTLAMINYVDRVALSVASKPIADEFGLSPVVMGYLFSSFLWTYLLCLMPMGILVDKFGSKIVNAAGITVWSAATMLTGLAPSYGALIVAWIVSEIGWRGSFLAVGAIGFLWLAAWLVWYDIPERVRWLGKEEREKIVRERGAPTDVLVKGSSSKRVLDL